MGAIRDHTHVSFTAKHVQAAEVLHCSFLSVKSQAATISTQAKPGSSHQRITGTCRILHFRLHMEWFYAHSLEWSFMRCCSVQPSTIPLRWISFFVLLALGGLLLAWCQLNLLHPLTLGRFLVCSQPLGLWLRLPPSLRCQCCFWRHRSLHLSLDCASALSWAAGQSDSILQLPSHRPSTNIEILLALVKCLDEVCNGFHNGLRLYSRGFVLPEGTFFNFGRFSNQDTGCREGVQNFASHLTSRERLPLSVGCVTQLLERANSEETW